MPALFELLENEHEPAVRVVLGHFVFVDFRNRRARLPAVAFATRFSILPMAGEKDDRKPR
jgi:hypothetical protein